MKLELGGVEGGEVFPKCYRQALSFGVSGESTVLCCFVTASTSTNNINTVVVRVVSVSDTYGVCCFVLFWAGGRGGVFSRLCVCVCVCAFFLRGSRSLLMPCFRSCPRPSSRKRYKKTVGSFSLERPS